MLVRRRADLRRKPSQERSAFTFEAILDAAERVILEEGTAALQMSLLGKRAGVSAGTLYQYFTDRLSIFMALADRAFARFLKDARRLAEREREAPLDAFLQRLSAGIAERACEGHRLFRALRPDLEGAGSAGVRVDFTEASADYLAALLRPKLDVPDARLRELARFMVWAADGLLDGALRRAEVAVPDLRLAILCAWRGVLGSW